MKLKTQYIIALSTLAFSIFLVVAWLNYLTVRISTVPIDKEYSVEYLGSMCKAVPDEAVVEIEILPITEVPDTLPDTVPDTVPDTLPETNVEPLKVTYYDVPLDKQLQDYTRELCEDYGLPYDLALAIMWQESYFTPTVISKTNDYGLMQINKCNHEWLKTSLGIKDFLDPYENVLGGVFLLARLYHKYDTLPEMLMAYNMGEAGAARWWKQGVYSSRYVELVLDKLEKLKDKLGE